VNVPDDWAWSMLLVKNNINKLVEKILEIVCVLFMVSTGL